MRIEVNGEVVETAAATLEAVIAEQGFEADAVATAMDGQFVPRGMRAETRLCAGAKLEVLAPMQGG